MAPCELYSLDWCRRRRLPKSNIVQLLMDREIELRRPGSHLIRGSREFYFSLPIMRSLRSRNRPLFYPLRFTPCGSRLIGMSLSLREVLIYDYLGVQMGLVTPPDQLFLTLFTHCRAVRVNHISMRNSITGELLGNAGLLVQDCCLVTADSRYLITCTAAPVSESSAILSRIHQNNESLPMNSQVSLEEIRFYSIDLKRGEISDRICFDFDIININQGVYLLDRLLAILSIQHQTIHLFTIDRTTGEFIPTVQIGRTMFDDDNLYLKSSLNPGTERFFTGFRQRFLTYMYEESVRKNETTDFLRNFNYYRELKMQKIQLVGPDLLLLRMDTTFDASSNSYLFILLKWRVGEVAAVFHRDSRRLFNLFEKFNETFRAGTSGCLDNCFPTSMEYSWYAKHHYNYVKSTKLSYSEKDIRRQFLSFLPYSCVSVPSITPYLDPEMFTFDDRALLNIERARVPSKDPFKIFSRRSNRLHVHLEFHNLDNTNVNGARGPNVRLIFHPTDPFAISVIKNHSDPLTTYHLPKCYNPYI